MRSKMISSSSHAFNVPSWPLKALAIIPSHPRDLFSRCHLLLANPLHTLNDTGELLLGGLDIVVRGANDYFSSNSVRSRFSIR